MTAICIPIFVKGGVDLEEEIGEAEEAAAGSTTGMIELRCDTATEKEMLEAIDLAKLPVIVTIRPKWEGGFSEKSDKERIGMWEGAMDAGAEYIDVELVAWEKSRAIREAIEDTAEKSGTRVVISNHSFGGRPGDLLDRMKRLRGVRAAHVLKIAWKAESILDGIDALRLTKASARGGWAARGGAGDGGGGADVAVAGAEVWGGVHVCQRFAREGVGAGAADSGGVGWAISVGEAGA